MSHQKPGAQTESPKAASVVKYKSALRKAIRKNQREPEINYLNITAMLDMMVIILVFLLKGMSSSSASIPQSNDLTLPTSMMDSEPSEEGTLIVISKSQILVGNDPHPVVRLPSREALASSGVEAKDKRGGPSDLFIVPLANSLQATRQIDKQLREAKGLDASGSEAIIVADSTTPYRLLIEVLYTLGQSEYSKYHLMVLSGSKQQ